MSGTSKGGKHGVSMGGLESSPKRKKRERKKRQREEERWAAQSGPVNVYFDPSVIKQEPSDEQSPDQPG